MNKKLPLVKNCNPNVNLVSLLFVKLCFHTTPRPPPVTRRNFSYLHASEVRSGAVMRRFLMLIFRLCPACSHYARGRSLNGETCEHLSAPLALSLVTNRPSVHNSRPMPTWPKKFRKICLWLAIFRSIYVKGHFEAPIIACRCELGYFGRSYIRANRSRCRRGTGCEERATQTNKFINRPDYH